MMSSYITIQSVLLDLLDFFRLFGEKRKKVRLLMNFFEYQPENAKKAKKVKWFHTLNRL
jgi:hypothetical protein